MASLKISRNNARFLRQRQYPGHCGPCSLSYGLCLLGIHVSQRKVAKASGRSIYRQFVEGLDETDLEKAARQYGVIATTILLTRHKKDSGTFVEKLRQHVKKGLPANLLVDDFGHWVSVLAYNEEQKRFVIKDPADGKSSLWSDKEFLRNAWNEDEDYDDDDPDDEPDQYFALLWRRKDGKRFPHREQSWNKGTI